MTLSRYTPAQNFTIFQPRWRDRTVLLAVYKVGTHNCIRFTKAPSMDGEYYISGEEVRKHPKQTNGTIDCYCVPLNKLELLERD
jgi:hypothetical protein